jgi:hypothetical protein
MATTCPFFSSSAVKGCVGLYSSTAAAQAPAGIDVHKKRLAVVVADVEVDEEYQFEQRRCASNPEQLHKLAE